MHRNPLENVLTKIWITRVLGDGAENGDKALKDLLIDGRQRLTCRDDHACHAWSCPVMKSTKRDVTQHTFYKMVIFGDLSRRTRAFDFGEH